MPTAAVNAAAAASNPPPKRLLFDRRYGWVLDEWKEPTEEALSGGRGMFCVVPLAKALIQKASETMDSVETSSELIEELCNLQLESSPELVKEIIEEEILPRTTVKSALRLRCVSKPWRSLIDTEPFINKHLRYSTTRTRGIFNHCSRCGPHFTHYYFGDKDDHPSLHSPPHDDALIAARCYVVGHHNGLLCILKLREQDEQHFYLWNPATRTSVQLPDPDLYISNFKVGFGWDERSGAYKVFLGVPDHPLYHDDGDEGDHDGRIAQIYSSETNSWRVVEHGSESKSKFGVSAHGRIYWLTHCVHVEYLDLSNEVFGKTMIDIPYKFGDDIYVWLWERRGSLCIVCDVNDETKRRRVMVMKKGKGKVNWAEDDDGGFASELQDMEFHGVHGAFTYVETLVSPPSPLLLEENN